MVGSKVWRWIACSVVISGCAGTPEAPADVEPPAPESTPAAVEPIPPPAEVATQESPATEDPPKEPPEEPIQGPDSEQQPPAETPQDDPATATEEQPTPDPDADRLVDPAGVADVVPADPRWSRFPAFIWWNKGPKNRGQVYQLMAQTGLGVNVEAQEQSDDEASARVPFYVGHLAGKGDLHLRKTVIAEQREQMAAEGADAVPVRPSCFSDRELLETLAERVREGVARHSANQPMAYALDDEISVTSGLEPLDYCYSPESLEDLRNRIKNRYQGIADLNDAWGTEFESLNDVVPRLTGQSREFNRGRNLDQLSFASWNERLEFLETAMALVLRKLINAAHETDEFTPVGFLGGQAPGAFGGFDWWKLTRHATFFEAYDHGLAPEIVHSFKRPGSRVVSTLFLQDDTILGIDTQLAFWRSLARGDDGVVIWSAEHMFEPRSGGAPSAVAKTVRKGLAAARQIKALLEPMDRAAPEVTIYVSQPSVRAGWMLDSWSDGDTWPRRLTSYENDNSSSIRSREGWGRLVSEMGFSLGFVDASEFRRVGGAEQATGVIILNQAHALADHDVYQLIRFVAVGGLVIVDGRAALFDEKLRGRTAQAFQALCGLTRNVEQTVEEYIANRSPSGDDTQSVSEYFGLPIAERVQAAPEAGARFERFGWVHSIGRGKVLYLNVSMGSYADLAVQQPQFAEIMRRVLADWIVDNSDLELPFHLAYDHSSRKVRIDHFRDAGDPVILLTPREEFDSGAVDLFLPDELEAVDLLTGRNLGTLRKIRLSVELTRPRLIRFREPW